LTKPCNTWTILAQRMIDFQTAQHMVLERLAADDRRRESPFTTCVSGFTEYEFGWVFFYNSTEFLETGDFRHCLGGNAPLIVDRNDGRLYITGTGRPIEHYVEEFRRGIRTLA
jgi:hypothetical protein